MNALTVVILAAGYGRRMGPFARMINKGLIPYDNKPLISHIIDKFDEGTKFIIACGHMGQQVKDYVGVVHQDKNITYVDIDSYDETNTGPATTIRNCAKHINGAFIWLSCDTLFDFEYRDKLDHNWIAVHPVDSNISQDYCWVQRDGNRIVDIINKQSSTTAVDAFIGLMYCKDSTYVDNLIAVDATEAYQGLTDNLELQAHTVRKWMDFGTYDKWKELSSGLKEMSFSKPNELFYYDNDKIIKFCVDHKLTDKKIQRAQLNLDCMPQAVIASGQFLVYDYVDGDIIYESLTPTIMDKLLIWTDSILWKKSELASPERARICKDFYYKKTYDRLNQFRTKYSDWSEPCTVNGHDVCSIDQYLDKIDWDELCNTSDWRFIHGDFQFENVIYNTISEQFTCIDWRTDFAGDNYGDLYYDLAKMLGGILLSYQAVKANLLEYSECNDHVQINDCSIEQADLYHDKLKEWCLQYGYNWHKVKLLVPLIYLNMSPLHEAPFDKYLVALAQLHFARIFNEYSTSN